MKENQSIFQFIKELWKKFKLFLFYWYYGKDAYTVVFSTNDLKKGDIVNKMDGINYSIVLNKSKKLSNGYYEYVLKAM